MDDKLFLTGCLFYLGYVDCEEGRAMTHEEAIAFALEDPLEEPAAKPETKPGQPSDGLLSNREIEVLSLVAEGLSDAEVAGRLYVSPRTVGGHLRGARGGRGGRQAGS